MHSMRRQSSHGDAEDRRALREHRRVRDRLLLRRQVLDTLQPRPRGRRSVRRDAPRRTLRRRNVLSLARPRWWPRAHVDPLIWGMPTRLRSRCGLRHGGRLRAGDERGPRSTRFRVPHTVDGRPLWRRRVYDEQPMRLGRVLAARRSYERLLSRMPFERGLPSERADVRRDELAAPLGRTAAWPRLRAAMNRSRDDVFALQ
jgi:hypothetical protein